MYQQSENKKLDFARYQQSENKKIIAVRFDIIFKS